jgi:hypothetical protein
MDRPRPVHDETPPFAYSALANQLQCWATLLAAHATCHFPSDGRHGVGTSNSHIYHQVAYYARSPISGAGAPARSIDLAVRSVQIRSVAGNVRGRWK